MQTNGLHGISSVITGANRWDSVPGMLSFKSNPHQFDGNRRPGSRLSLIVRLTPTLDATPIL